MGVLEPAKYLRERVERRLRLAKLQQPARYDQLVAELSIELHLDLIERLERVELKLDGICPGCRTKPKKIVITEVDRDYPAYATKLREQGVDPRNGHLLTCPEPPT